MAADLSPAAVLEAALFQLLLLDEADEILSEHAGDDASVHEVETFEDARVLTRDRGLVITLSSGEVFQLTIVQSR